jgi:isocitrate/isopropylmalate dehydrogenase
MEKRTIVTLPGDGIGIIVLDQAIRVLNAAGLKADYINGDIGWKFWCKEGNPLPQRTLDLIAKYKIALFGAITSKPKDEAEAELAPNLQPILAPLLGFDNILILIFVSDLVSLIEVTHLISSEKVLEN